MRLKYFQNLTKRDCGYSMLTLIHTAMFLCINGSRADAIPVPI